MNTSSSKLLASVDRIRAIGVGFEALLRAGSTARIEDYCSNYSGLDSGLLICELLAHEVAYSRSVGGRLDASSFQNRLPIPAALIETICREDVIPISRAHQIQDVFVVVSQVSSADQPRYLEEQCGDDAELRNVVATLLCRDQTTGSFAAQFSAHPTSRFPEGKSDRTLPVLSTNALKSVFPERFQILAEIGAGGFGTVYKAWDDDRKSHVALKALNRMDFKSVDLFKREFRALADVTHPNLVSLYELFLIEPFWFLTMELVQGVSFNQYARNPVTDFANRNPGFDEQRLRNSAQQLAQGIDSLHLAGVLHRDLKSSNVLVAEGGRVVVLDFGMAAILDANQLHQVTDHAVAGTCSYMSPEQAAGIVISPASDWYSFGTMLFEVLTGRLPFLGKPLQVLMDKQRIDPPAPRELVATIPEDLDRLCTELLRRNPSDRPHAAEILQRLSGGQQSSPAVHKIPSTETQGLPFVGREVALEQLHSAFRDVQAGTAKNILIGGSPGVGKSALVGRFLNSILRREDVVVLSGRCYERESVPYKAVDALVDSLAAYLASLPAQTAEVYLPIDTLALVRVFPSLRRVSAVTEAAERSSKIPDPQEIRRRAFRALRELLCRLGNRLDLILVIDDLQWGDVDSALLMNDLLQPPDSPIMLFLGTHRSEDVSCPFLSTLFQSSHDYAAPILWQKLQIDPLSLDESRRLLMGLTGRSSPEVEAIAHQSRGNPFFVRELAYFLQSGDYRESKPEGKNESTLDRVLWSRISSLPAGAKRLMEVIAVSGRPLRVNDAERASGVVADELRLLRAAHLIRSTGPESKNIVECYHDCIRESTVSHLTPEVLQEHNRNLAMTLESAVDADPEHLAMHFEGCANPERASHYYGLAAARAADLLAFDRSAELYDRAINLALFQESRIRNLHVSRGDALANAGRGREAAREYLLATSGAEAEEKLDLNRRAAEQFLISGHLDEGLESLRVVLKSSGMRFPTTPLRALIKLLWYRLLLRIRGIGFRQRDISQISNESLSRIDTCWTVAVGLTMIDPIRAACFMSCGLLHALRAGEPYRVARAMAIEAVHESSVAGPRGKQYANLLLRRAGEIAETIDSPHASGLVTLAQGMIAILSGNSQVSLEKCEEAEKYFRDHCVRLSWELDTSQIHSIYACFYRGDFVQLRSRLTAFLKDAEERGDTYAEMSMSGNFVDLELHAGNVEGARHALEESVRLCSRPGFELQQFTIFYGESHFHLYSRSGSTAWSVARERRKNIRNSLLGRVQYIRVMTAYLCGRCALAAASGDALLLREAEREASLILSERVSWARPFATQILAGAAVQKGDREKAKALFDSVARDFDEHGMVAYSNASRRRYGELLGGQGGTQLVQEIDAWMYAQGIKNPECAAHIFAP